MLIQPLRLRQSTPPLQVLIQQRDQQEHETLTLNRGLFFGAFILNLILAVVVFVYIRYLFVDSIARTMHAYYAVWGFGAPHLAAIGFVWMPLPTLAQLPLVLWKPLAFGGLAGGILSAFCMAISIVALDAIVRFCGLGGERWLLLAAFQLHPMILLYAANGMSEAMLISTTLWCTLFFLRWSRSRRSVDLCLLSISAALAIMTRYEGAAVAFTGLLGIAAVCVATRTSRLRAENELLIYLLPPAFVTFLWVFFNWVIMSDPFYFFSGAYSNKAQIAFFPKELAVLTHNPLATSLYVGERLWLMMPLYGVVTLLAGLVALLRRNVTMIGAMLFPFSVLAFGWLNQFQGQSYGWFRFFIYAIPGAILAIGLLRQAAGGPAWLRRFLVCVFAAFALLGNVVTLPAMLDPKVGREEFPVVKAIMQLAPVQHDNSVEQRMLSYLRANVSGREVLVDDFSALELIRLAGGTDMFVAGVDPDFPSVLNAPAGHVLYLLIPHPEGLGSLDAINVRYPGIFDGKQQFVELVQDWQTWRLFRVLANP